VARAFIKNRLHLDNPFFACLFARLTAAWLRVLLFDAQLCIPSMHIYICNDGFAQVEAFEGLCLQATLSLKISDCVLGTLLSPWNCCVAVAFLFELVGKCLFWQPCFCINCLMCRGNCHLSCTVMCGSSQLVVLTGCQNQAGLPRHWSNTCGVMRLQCDRCHQQECCKAVLAGAFAWALHCCGTEGPWRSVASTPACLL
jgi:hypothetical protein